MATAASAIPAADPEVRRSGIGSSDAPIIVGLSKYATPADLYMEKRGLATRDVPEFVAEAAEMGKIMEPVILREYARRERVHVIGHDDRGRVVIWTPDGEHRNVNAAGRWSPPEGPDTPIPDRVYQAIAGTVRHPDREWMMCHLDGLALSTDMEPVQMLEAKTASEWVSREWGDAETDEVPPGYLVQVQHAAAVARGAFDGLALPIRVPVILGGNRFRVYRLAYDADLVTHLVQLEEAFWTAYQDGDMPEIEPNALGLATLKRLFPNDDRAERVVPTTDPLHALACELAAMAHAAKRIEAEKARLHALIQGSMGETRKLVGDGWSYTWATVPGRVSTKAVIAELAERAGVTGDELEEIQERHRGPASRQPYPKVDKLAAGG